MSQNQWYVNINPITSYLSSTSEFAVSTNELKESVYEERSKYIHQHYTQYNITELENKHISVISLCTTWLDFTIIQSDISLF